MFADGNVVDVNTAQNNEFIHRYNEELKTRTLRLLKNMK